MSPVEHLIVDRDGVLNRERVAGFTYRVADWEWEQGSLEALSMIGRNGMLLSVVTNQSCIGRGVATRHEVDELHEWLSAQFGRLGVSVVGIFVCPHSPNHGCRCRKPRPGLVVEAMRRSGVAADRTLMVGDAERDWLAGRAAGIAVAAVMTGQGDPVVASARGVPAFADLAAVSRSCWSRYDRSVEAG